MVLHLPIGVFLFTFLLVLVSLKSPKSYSRVINLGLGFSFYSAVIASILGYLLYLSGGYSIDAQVHLWTSIVTTLFMGLSYYLFRQGVSNRLFRIVFTISVTSLFVSSHFGAQLTHGKGYLKFPSPDLAPTFTSDSIDIYSQVVAPIMDKKCISCHGMNKRKGGLLLSSAEGISAGGENGPLFDFSDLSESRLLYHLELPIEHELRMPPKSRTQLTQVELDLIRNWVLEGATTKGLTAYSQLVPQIKDLLNQFFPPKLKEVAPPNSKDLERILAQNFRVDIFSANHNYISIKYLGDTLTKVEFEALYRLRKNIIDLDLRSVFVEPYFFEKFKGFRTLDRLRLDNTNITDKELSYVNDLPIEMLSLTNTQITQGGLEGILENNHLKKVFLWNTSIPLDEQQNLKEQSSIVLDFGTGLDFAGKQRVELPMMVGQQTLFVDSLAVAFHKPIESMVFRYTFNEQEPDSLSEIINDSVWVRSTGNLKVKSFVDGWLPSETREISFRKVANLIEEYDLESIPAGNYAGESKLFDLELGTTNFSDGHWVGHNGTDLSVLFDLPENPKFTRLTVSSLRSYGGWILFPKSIKIYGVANGNSNLLTQLTIGEANEAFSGSQIQQFDLEFNPESFEQLRVEVENQGVLPSWHVSAGQPSWVFVDEVFLW